MVRRRHAWLEHRIFPREPKSPKAVVSKLALDQVRAAIRSLQPVFASVKQHRSCLTTSHCKPWLQDAGSLDVMLRLQLLRPAVGVRASQQPRLLDVDASVGRRLPWRPPAIYYGAHLLCHPAAKVACLVTMLV